MQKYIFTVERAFTQISVQPYSVEAESEEDAIKMFTEAFENCDEQSIADGQEIVSEEKIWSPKAVGRLEGNSEFVLEMDFSEDEKTDVKP